MPRFAMALFGIAAMLAAAFAETPKHREVPDVLTTSDGKKVTTADEWTKQRKPELQELFQIEMYGQLPRVKTKVTGKVLFENAKAFGGLGTLQEIELSLGIDKCPPLYVLLAIPNVRPKAGSPVFVGLNFHGNHCLVADDGVRIPTGWMYDKYPGVKDNKATVDGRGKAMGVWPIEAILKAGYAVATCYSGDVAEDRKEADGPLAPFVAPKPEGALPRDHTATIALWAWGIHRIVDFASTHPQIDPKRIAVVGHSRLGKAALLAGAFDERIALTIPHQSGCGGAAPSRHNDPKAEGVKRINEAFPHWFCGSFKSYGESQDLLPFDQHSLLALCAPRPVLYTNATEDEWANPSGQFQMMKHATAVYELLGVDGCKADAMPKTGKLLDSRLGYWIREGKHEMNAADWATFIEFAGKWMK